MSNASREEPAVGPVVAKPSKITPISGRRPPVSNDNDQSGKQDFYAELRRRGVLHAGTTYIVISWLVAQVADLVGEIFGVPQWALQALLILLAAGFPVALMVSWMFEFTLDGIKADNEIDPAAARRLARCRNIALAVIAILVLAASALLGMSRPEYCVIPTVSLDNSTASATQRKKDLYFASICTRLNSKASCSRTQAQKRIDNGYTA